MAFCTECGTQLPSGARFCPSCGASATPGDRTPSIAPDAAPATAIAPDVPPSAAAVPPSYDASPPPAYGAPPPATPPAPPPGAPPRATSYEQPVHPGGGSGGVAWILPLLILVAALAIGYTLFAPGRDGPSSQKPSGEAAGGAGEGTAEDGGARTASGGESGRASDGGDAVAPNGGGRVVSAATLDSAFNRDPAGAAALYRGPIRVSGVIATMVQPGPTPALSMEGRTRFNYMIVNFPTGYRERLAPLSKGQFVQVSCDQARGFAGTTILDGCELE